MSNSAAPTFDIAIIGGGFSGCMTLVHCLKQARRPLKVALFSRSNLARGVAYSTQDMHHLLNVPAHNMSAFPDAPSHFVEWLAAREQTQHYTPTDFVPRRIYGEYLGEVFAAALAADGHAVTLIEEEVRRIDADRTITTPNQSVTADCIALATGNEASQEPEGHNVISPWALLQHPLPENDQNVLILGAGLTGVDAFLTLRARGFKGPIYLASRSGRIPQPHLDVPQKYPWEGAFPAQPSILLQRLRHAIADHGRWQEVVDSLRPHLQSIWKSFDIATRTRFLKRHFGLWNIHRHRMAPQIWNQLQHDPALHIVSTRRTALPPVTLTIHCIGQEYRTRTLRNPLLQQLLRDALVEEHPTGFGVKADGHQIGNGLYAIGPLLIGELLETTAVPELRAQAAELARQLLLTIDG